MIAGLVEAAFGDGDQRAGERRALRRGREAFQALVECKCLEIGRHRDRLAARAQAVTAIVEAHDLLDPLDADIEHAVAARSATRHRTSRARRAACRRRRASAPFRRRRCRPACRRDRRCGRASHEPWSVTARKCSPSGSTCECRKCRRRPDRCEVSTSPPRNSSAPKRVSVSSRLSKDVIGAASHLRSRCAPAALVRSAAAIAPATSAATTATSAASQAPPATDPGGARLQPSSDAACAVRRAARRDAASAAACSSNSSASFSVMAPPSSSASTMVTARR